MAKLQNCQFIEIKIDNKVISGSSEEKTYKNWMEGFSDVGLNMYSGPDGTYFYGVQSSIMVTKESSKFYEQYLKRGYKEITITIVHRGSDKHNPNYEIQRTTYHACRIENLHFKMIEEKLFMDVYFIFEGTVEVTFNVPNSDESALDKIGPIKYDIPKKTLL